MACKAELYRKAVLHLKKKEKKKTRRRNNELFVCVYTNRLTVELRFLNMIFFING